MSLSDYTSITVSRETQAPSQQSFNTLGILAYHSVYADYARQYDANADGLAQMVTDGFNTYDPAYRMASRFVSQDGHPPYFRVLRRETAYQQGVELEPDQGGVVPPAALVITVSITGPNGTTIDYTRTSAGVSKNAEATALANSIDVDPLGWGAGGSAEFVCAVSGGGAGDKIEIDSAAADGKLWYFTGMEYLIYEDVTPDPGIVADLTTIRTSGSDDFYGIIIDSESDAEVAALAAHVETLNKIFGFASRSTAVPTAGAGDIFTALEAADYDRTFGVSTAGSLATYPAASWMGLKLGATPGFTNWAFASSAAGVVADTWTAAEKGYIRTTKGGNYYIEEAEISHFYPGQMFSGEWIDIIMLVDWTVARIQEAVFGSLITADKIPYTAKGAEQIKGECFSVVRQQMRDDDSGGYVKGSELFTYPEMSTISTANKASRNLPDCTLYCQFTNAINTVGLELTLSY